VLNLINDPDCQKCEFIHIILRWCHNDNRRHSHSFTHGQKFYKPVAELDAGGKLNLDGEEGQVKALKDRLRRNVVEVEDAALIVFTAW
jgi:hypothetical protein